jgi:hypothetical protein
VTTATRIQFSALLVLILGMVGLMNPIFEGVLVCSLLAILGSHVAPLVLKQTRMRERWMVLWGAVLGYTGVGLLYGLALYQPEMGARQQATAVSNNNALVAIYAACHSFSLDHDGVLPDSIEELSEKRYLDAKYLKSPSVPEKKCGFRMVAAGRLADLAPNEVLASEAVCDPPKYFMVIRGDARVLLMKVPPDSIEKLLGS